MKKILITGGAGFVGSNLARQLKLHYSDTSVVALDNLKRRGSELMLPQLKAAGVEFVHGDLRIKEDLSSLGKIDLVIDCAAEPSVLAGRDGTPDYVLQTNLLGTMHCLELCRRHDAAVIFLSTSRVYPIKTLNQLRVIETETRFDLDDTQDIEGATSLGISERFPLDGARSLYGTTKLCSELLLQEYREAYNLRGIVNRCGILTGPWQMGKVDQGVVVLWVAQHLYRKSLSYIGFKGTGKQVRDILHVDDLFSLIHKQITNLQLYDGMTFNIGGGRESSLSLRELTSLCQELTGITIPITKVNEDRPGDIISYISDSSTAERILNWKPSKTPRVIIEEIIRWISENKKALEVILT